MTRRTVLQVSCIHLVFVFLLASAAQAQTAPPAGMVGWWAGDGNAKDISGNGLNGALFNSGGYVVGEVGQVRLGSHEGRGRACRAECWLETVTSMLGSRRASLPL